MQTAITPTTSYLVADSAIARPAIRTKAPTKGNAFVKTLVRKWGLIGVLALMGSSTVYAVSQLMMLAH